MTAPLTNAAGRASIDPAQAVASVLCHVRGDPQLRQTGHKVVPMEGLVRLGRQPPSRRRWATGTNSSAVHRSAAVGTSWRRCSSRSACLNQFPDRLRRGLEMSGQFLRPTISVDEVGNLLQAFREVGVTANGHRGLLPTSMMLSTLPAQLQDFRRSATRHGV